MAYIKAPVGVVGYSYVVKRMLHKGPSGWAPGWARPEGRYSFDLDAVKALQEAALKTWKSHKQAWKHPPDIPAPPKPRKAQPAAPAHPATVANTPPSRTTEQQEPSTTESAGRPMLSLDELVAHPVIRATVIASYEAERRTGRRHDSAVVFKMAQTAVAVLEIQEPGSTAPETARDADIERRLVGLLLGTLIERKQHDR